jgi:hypothetical protein
MARTTPAESELVEQQLVWRMAGIWIIIIMAASARGILALGT